MKFLGKHYHITLVVDEFNIDTFSDHYDASYLLCFVTTLQAIFFYNKNV